MADQKDVEYQIREAAYTWCKSLCECAGVADETVTFWNRLTASPGVYSEYVYYMINQNFACQYKVEGVSLVDILVWQVDYFKAGMDMGRTERDNPDRLLFSAFKTMLDMEQNPKKYAKAFHEDTGTDYPGKY